MFEDDLFSLADCLIQESNKINAKLMLIQLLIQFDGLGRQRMPLKWFYTITNTSLVSLLFVFSIIEAQAIPLSSTRITLDWSSLTIDTTPGLTLNQTARESLVSTEVLNETDTDFQDDFSSDWTTDLTVESVVFGAYAESSTNSRQAGFITGAQGPEEWSLAFANGWRFFDFSAEGNGTLNVSLDYSVELMVATDEVYELGEAVAYIWLDIDNFSSQDFNYQENVHEILLTDGAMDMQSLNGTISGSLNFNDGDEGGIWIEAESVAFQQTIPEPGILWQFVLCLGLLLSVEYFKNKHRSNDFE